ncbi:hemerythrin domain-containing protein [Phenylobacterium immobile]|uniref:hemerythrin domain-containing protein n=1 Tax=Phenylobacterium immobile TaxID=21 RepID=UPI000B26BBBA|nr:hemerythrin domain-containing protein [Phenylobacterium immobile]
MTTRSTSTLALAAATGLALGLLLPPARKALMQAPSLAAQDWIAGLTAEHRIVQHAFQALLLTDSDDVRRRKLLLAKIAYALTKHGVEEENTIYPALFAVQPTEAKRLSDDHVGVKRAIYALRRMPADDADWLPTAEAFSHEVDHHIHEEEDEIFPRLRDALTAEENRKLAAMLNWEGFKAA